MQLGQCLDDSEVIAPQFLEGTGSVFKNWQAILFHIHWMCLCVYMYKHTHVLIVAGLHSSWYNQCLTSSTNYITTLMLYLATNGYNSVWFP